MRGSRIKTDQSPKRAPKAKDSRGVQSILSPEMFSESFRQDIGHILAWKVFYHYKYI